MFCEQVVIYLFISHLTLRVNEAQLVWSYLFSYTILCLHLNTLYLSPKLKVGWVCYSLLVLTEETVTKKGYLFWFTCSVTIAVFSWSPSAPNQTTCPPLVALNQIPHLSPGWQSSAQNDTIFTALFLATLDRYERGRIHFFTWLRVSLKI